MMAAADVGVYDPADGRPLRIAFRALLIRSSRLFAFF
jgi:hypothetical protein